MMVLIYDANLQIDFDNNEQLMSLPIGTRYVVLTLNNQLEQIIMGG